MFRSLAGKLEKNKEGWREICDVREREKERERERERE